MTNTHKIPDSLYANADINSWRIKFYSLALQNNILKRNFTDKIHQKMERANSREEILKVILQTIYGSIAFDKFEKRVDHFQKERFVEMLGNVAENLLVHGEKYEEREKRNDSCFSELDNIINYTVWKNQIIATASRHNRKDSIAEVFNSKYIDLVLMSVYDKERNFTGANEEQYLLKNVIKRVDNNLSAMLIGLTEHFVDSPKQYMDFITEFTQRCDNPVIKPHKFLSDEMCRTLQQIALSKKDGHAEANAMIIESIGKVKNAATADLFNKSLGEEISDNFVAAISKVRKGVLSFYLAVKQFVVGIDKENARDIERQCDDLHILDFDGEHKIKINERIRPLVEPAPVPEPVSHIHVSMTTEDAAQVPPSDEETDAKKKSAACDAPAVSAVAEEAEPSANAVPSQPAVRIERKVDTHTDNLPRHKDFVLISDTQVAVTLGWAMADIIQACEPEITKMFDVGAVYAGMCVETLQGFPDAKLNAMKKIDALAAESGADCHKHWDALRCKIVSSINELDKIKNREDYCNMLTVLEHDKCPDLHGDTQTCYDGLGNICVENPEKARAVHYLFKLGCAFKREENNQLDFSIHTNKSFPKFQKKDFLENMKPEQEENNSFTSRMSL